MRAAIVWRLSLGTNLHGSARWASRTSMRCPYLSGGHQAFARPPTVRSNVEGETAAYSFLNALAPNAKRTMPSPSRARVKGHGKGHPNMGLGVPVAISIPSKIRSIPATISSTLATVNIVHILREPGEFNGAPVSFSGSSQATSKTIATVSSYAFPHVTGATQARDSHGMRHCYQPRGQRD
jgi:hypothetical protein